MVDAPDLKSVDRKIVPVQVRLGAPKSSFFQGKIMTNKLLTVRELDNEKLLEEFEFAVRWNHYDPHCGHEVIYNEDDLRDEVARRLKLSSV